MYINLKVENSNFDICTIEIVLGDSYRNGHS
jgi:hypothetical protein